MNLQELFLLNLLDQWNQPEAIGSPPYYLGVCPN